MKTIYETLSASDYSASMTRFVEHNGRKFRISLRIANGDPIGFNYNCYFSVMTQDGDFKEVADSRQLGIRFGNDYHASASVKEEQMKRAAKEIESFIKILY